MSWIRTVSGRRIDPLAAEPGEIVITDIAHALSNICRYTGHCSHFYSVAQHSVLVSVLLEIDNQPLSIQMQGLLHDATEAYMNDIARPLKMAPEMREYRRVEDALERKIAAVFGFETLTPAAVKTADMQVLASEIQFLMGNPTDWELSDPPRIEIEIKHWTPEEARSQFMSRYQNLTYSLRKVQACQKGK